MEQGLNMRVVWACAVIVAIWGFVGTEDYHLERAAECERKGQGYDRVGERCDGKAETSH